MKPTPAELIHQLDNPATSEPALKVGTLTASVAALGTLLLYFFPKLPESVLMAIIVLLAAILPVITAMITRGKVWSPASVKDVVEESVSRAVAIPRLLPVKEKAPEYPRLRSTDRPYKFPPDVNRDISK